MYFKTNTTLHYTIYNTVPTLLYLPENNRNTRKGDKSAAKSNRARNEIASNERLQFFFVEISNSFIFGGNVPSGPFGAVVIYRTRNPMVPRLRCTYRWNILPRGVRNSFKLARMKITVQYWYPTWVKIYFSHDKPPCAKDLQKPWAKEQFTNISREVQCVQSLHE